MAEVRVGGEQRQAPAREGLAGPLAEIGVEAHQLGQLAEPLAVGRVGDQQALRAGLEVLGAFQLGEARALQGDQRRDAGAHGVGLRRRQRRRTLVEAVEPAAAALSADARPRLGLALELAPAGRVMAGPALEAEALTVQVGRHVGGHHRRLDQQGAGAAQRVDQRRALAGQFRPAGADQQCGGQVLLERRMADVTAIAAAMQAVAGEVDAQGQPAPVQVGIEAQVRLAGIDARPRLAVGLQAIDHAVLDGLGAEAGMADLGGPGQGRAARQVIAPRHPGRGRTQLVGGLDALLAHQAQHHPVGQPRPQAGPVGRLEVGLEVHPGQGRLARFGPQRRQLLGQQQLEALGAGGEEGQGGGSLSFGHEEIHRVASGRPRPRVA